VVLWGSCLGKVCSVVEATLITNGFKDHKLIQICLIEIQNSFFDYLKSKHSFSSTCRDEIFKSSSPF
jgi:hypothetical protein